MASSRFYSLTENEVEVGSEAVLAVAAQWWSESPDERVVYEMSVTQLDKFGEPIRLGPVSVSLLRTAVLRKDR
jgi:hypothetical protein